MKRAFAISVMGTLFSLSMGFPLFAQETVESPGIVTEEDSSPVPDGQEDSGDGVYPRGFPQPGEVQMDDTEGTILTNPDSEPILNNPDGMGSDNPDMLNDGQVSPNPDSVIIIIDGETRSVSPTVLEESSFPDRSEDTGTSDRGTATSESEDNSMVTYPPADSVEDLEPEDILAQ